MSPIPRLVVVALPPLLVLRVALESPEAGAVVGAVACAVIAALWARDRAINRP